MKNIVQLASLTWVAVIFQGCAGYNNTMFMTKSNAGLDFDAKPPTVEINIARKEAVIAPSFEGGQTLPVLASFRPSAGANSFTSFFMGVDQTFAGGDAAYAMSKLYDQPTANDKSQYDSAIHLNQAPAYNDWFRSVPGTGKVRPLLFGTDTSLGLKVAWSGAGGQIPDTVKLGFNRKEFAWAPLSTTPASVNAKGQADNAAVTVKMPAFLATIESKQEISNTGVNTNKIHVESIQYFATGDSAIYMAMQKDVRAAMISRMDPNSQAYMSRFSSEGFDVFSDILFSDGIILAHWADHGDKMAAAYLDALNNLSNLGLPTNYRNDSIPMYVFDPANLLLQKNNGAALSVSTDLDGITGYLSSLEASQANLTNALAKIEQKKTLKLQTGAAGAKSDITADMVPKLAADLATLNEYADKLKAALASNVDVKAADYYVQHKRSMK